jgi:hypothetical protein
MPEQTVTPELRRWIVDQAEAGVRPEDLMASLRRAGWDEAVAADAMESALRERLDEVDAQRRADSGPRVPVPEPDLAMSPPLVIADGHPVHVVAALQRPRVVVLRRAADGRRMRRAGRTGAPAPARSETVDTLTGGSEVNSRAPATACSSAAPRPRWSTASSAASRRWCAGRWSVARACRCCATAPAPNTDRTTTTSTPTTPAPRPCCAVAASAWARW